MDALTAIVTRRSAAKLGEPGPSRAQIVEILEAGVRAPDHGRLSPWRFVVLEGAARARLGEAIAELKRRKKPEASPAELDRERAKAQRAPVIVAVAARLDQSGRIPEIEQVLAAGAATQNMFLAASALGFGAMWKTGEAAYDDDVKAALGLEASDRIVAFLYLGTTILEAPRREVAVEPLTIWL